MRETYFYVCLDTSREVPHWIWTRLESNNKGHYLVGYGNVDMDKLTVRVKGGVTMAATVYAVYKSVAGTRSMKLMR